MPLYWSEEGNLLSKRPSENWIVWRNGKLVYLLFNIFNKNIYFFDGRYSSWELPQLNYSASLQWVLQIFSVKWCLSSLKLNEMPLKGGLQKCVWFSSL